MKSRSVFLAAFILFSSQETVMPQAIDEKILMTVNGREVTAGEFINMYRKSPDQSEKEDIDDYLEQFKVFKLKVADAIEQGFDTTRAFRSELGGYRRQLAASYLTDPGIREELIREMYRKSLIEIKASHILLKCPPDAMPKDTLNAWNKAMAIRRRILDGELFENAARESSDDRSAVINGGNLGWFALYQMVKPFEDAAWSLTPGDISMPVRTSFGYHLIRVSDRRPSMGKIRVAHIMKAVPANSDEKTVAVAKSGIDTVYKLLSAGRPFGQLAALYSDHKESASGNGELKWFGAGEIIPDFADAAFSISDTGKYTQPVRTIFGFHIIKLLEKKPPPIFDEARPLIESKIRDSDLEALQRQSIIRKLKKEYSFRIDQDVYRWFIKHTDTLIINGKSSYNLKKVPAEDIYTFAGQSMPARDFAAEVGNAGFRSSADDPKKFIDQAIESVSSQQIYEYENSVLERKYSDFRYLMKEFHDGILLFEISSRKVWDRTRTDSSGLYRYYGENKNNYLSKRALEGKLYSLNIPDGMSKLVSTYEKNKGRPDGDQRMTEKFNDMGDTLLTISERIWSKGDDIAIDGLEWKPGVQTFIKNNVPSLIFVKNIHEPVPLPFSSIQAEMISGYQDMLMAEWIKQLKDKYVVEIDSEVLAAVKSLLNDD
jgi:peptidyl-prolyl cis-trans isomerase SurA